MTISNFSLVVLLLITPLTKNNPLKQYQWKNRILLLYSSNSNFDEQVRDIDRNGFTERDLIVFKISKNSTTDPRGKVLSKEEHDWLLEKYMLGHKDFQVVLIGKDGGIKLKSESPVGNNQLFGLIDSMPMRVQEMRQGQ